MFDKQKAENDQTVVPPGGGTVEDNGHPDQSIWGESSLHQTRGDPVGGDLVAAAVRDAFDDLVGAEPAQVVADLAAGHVLWGFPELGGEVVPQVAAGEAGGPEREGAAGAQQGLDAGVGEAHPGDAGAGGADDRAGDRFQRGGSVGGVVADAFGVQQAPAGGVADLGHGGQVSQLFADAEVARLVQRGLGAERPSIFQVLLHLGLLVVQVQVGASPAGDHLGPEGPGSAALAAAADLAAEDDVHLVRAADVDVVADELLEEDPAGQGPVQRHGGGEFDLLD